MSKNREELQSWLDSAQEMLDALQRNPGTYNDIFNVVCHTNQQYDRLVKNRVSSNVALRLCVQEDTLFEEMKREARLHVDDESDECDIDEANFVDEVDNMVQLSGILDAAKLKHQEFNTLFHMILIVQSKILRVTLLLSDQSI